MLEALIIGGGIAGPVAGVALRRAGVAATVYEAYPADAPDTGAFLTLAANGQDALRAVDLAGPVEAAGFPAPRVEVIGADGAVAGGTDLTASGVAPPRTLRRSTLCRLLREQAVERGVPVEHGRRLAAVERTPAGRVRALFEDGSRAEGDVLIGADGVHSVVRRALDPDAPAPRFTGLTIVCGYHPGTLGEPIDGYRMIFGSRVFFGCTTAPDGATWWFARVRGDEPGRADDAGPEELRAMTLDALAGERTPAAGIVAATEHLTGTDAYELPTLPTWQDGSTVVIGDAAHVASPASAQGASLAAEDPVMLARCLRDLPGPASALAGYERLRRDRVERVVDAGSRTGRSAGPRQRQAGDTDWLYRHHIDWDAPVKP